MMVPQMIQKKYDLLMKEKILELDIFVRKMRAWQRLEIMELKMRGENMLLC